MRLRRELVRDAVVIEPVSGCFSNDGGRLALRACGGFSYRWPAELRLPFVERRTAHPVPPADVGGRHACLLFRQDRDYLLVGAAGQRSYNPPRFLRPPSRRTVVFVVQFLCRPWSTASCFIVYLVMNY